MPDDAKTAALKRCLKEMEMRPGGHAPDCVHNGQNARCDCGYFDVMRMVSAALDESFRSLSRRETDPEAAHIIDELLCADCLRRSGTWGTAPGHAHALEYVQRARDEHGLSVTAALATWLDALAERPEGDMLSRVEAAADEGAHRVRRRP